MADVSIDPVAEGRRIAGAARQRQAPVRLTGGVAIALRCPSAAIGLLRRPYADVDVVVRKGDGSDLEGLFVDLGYKADREFNAIHGARRQLYWSSDGTRQVDVFIDRYEMCHRLDLRDRLAVHPETIPLADLLLTKLQVVEANEKDLIDIATLLSDHALTDDESGINRAYIAALAGSDWGWWRTMTMVAERAAQYAREREIAVGTYDVPTQVSALLAVLEAAPKSTRWRMRARVGDRLAWYELPEEKG